MMRYNNIINGLLVIASITAFAACTEDTYDNSAAEWNGVFQFSGLPSIYTRADVSADDDQKAFEAGTKYQLFAVENDNWNANYLQKTPSKNAIEGTETNEHTISFDGNNKFNNHSLNFYAVTLSDKEYVPEIKYNADNSAPTCYVSYENGALTDVMWAGNLKNQTYKNSGKLQLNFEHTLSKLHIYAQKNEELANSTVVLKEVKLIDYLSGDLSLATGEFSSATDTRVDNTAHTHSVYKADTEINEETAKNEIFSAMTFPTRGTDTDSHALGLKVTTKVDDYEKTTTYRIKEVDVENTTDNKNPKYKAFKFKPNYEYDIVLTMTQTTMVVTVIPRVYDWIDDNSDYEDTQIGSSVTFGGVTWMDRNLGATSADATKSIQSWEASRGFYYQFGRSIPYYLNGSCLDPDVKDPINAAPTCKGANKTNNAKPFPYVPGHYDAVQRTDKKKGYDDCAQDPGETDINKSFSFSSSEQETEYTVHNSAGKEEKKYDGHGRDWASEHSVSATYWDQPEHQPCPKGWRLPTKDEFLSIVPSSQNAGDITFLNHSGTYSITVNYDVHNEKAVYVGVPSDKKEEKWGTIYAIKRLGTSNAYRVRWQIKRVGNTSIDKDKCDTGGDAQGYRSVLVISRYPAEILSTLTTSNYNTEYTDWDNPVETLMLPISGYIHVDGGAALIYAGSEAIYHTSTADTNNNKFWSFRIKFSGDTNQRYLYMWNEERRGYGCSVRCVRDKNVN